MKGRLRVLAGAAAGAAAITGTAYGLVSQLPSPRADEALGVRILDRLDAGRGSGATISLGGETLAARCHSLPPWRSLVLLGDGRRIVLSGTTARYLPARRAPAGEPARSPERLAAEADLAGSYVLYRVQLRIRLAQRWPLVAGTTRVDGVEAYRIRLGRDRPRVELVVARDTLRPLAVRYVSNRLRGSSRLGPPARRGQPGC